MPQLPISEVALRIGIQASAIRYYEQIGLLPPAHRINGQRRYDSTGVYRLAVIQKARQLGFSLDEIRELFLGFQAGRPGRTADRWQTLSKRKLKQLDDLARDVKTMRGLLQRMIRMCSCETAEQCGRKILTKGIPRFNPRTLGRNMTDGRI